MYSFLQPPQGVRGTGAMRVGAGCAHTNDGGVNERGREHGEGAWRMWAKSQGRGTPSAQQECSMQAAAQRLKVRV